MLKIENLKSFNWENALYGMRNPKESWDRIDSKFGFDNFSYDDKINGKRIVKKETVSIGTNDYDLCRRLCTAKESPTHHRKFMRQIFISCHVTAPWYWWKEYETFQIGTTENSTSTMHKLGSRHLTEDDFSFDKVGNFEYELIYKINEQIGKFRKYKELHSFKHEKTQAIWRSLIQIIPASFLYTRTISLNYEVLANQYKSRKTHKLIEWHQYLNEMIKGLPYPELFTLKFKHLCKKCGTYKDVKQYRISTYNWERLSNPWLCLKCLKQDKQDNPKYKYIEIGD
jgi:hypothetical protein